MVIFTGWMFFVSPNRQCQSTEGNSSSPVYTMQPVVKLVWQPAAWCKQAGSTTGWIFVYMVQPVVKPVV